MIKEYKRKEDKLDKSARKAEIKRLRDLLVNEPQKIQAAKLPVVVLVEGWDCAGKGNLIRSLICELDPRFYSVKSFERTPESATGCPGPP